MNYKSLSTRTLSKMSIRITVVVLLTTGLSYLHLTKALEDKKKDTLEKYIRERGARERIIFRDAEANHKVLASEFKRLYKLKLKDPDLKRKYNALVKSYPDGVIRNRNENFDGGQEAGIFMIDTGIPSTEYMAKILVATDLVNRFGLPLHHHFQDTYFTFPESSLVIFWPEEPRWVFNADARLNILKEDYYLVSTPALNPSRGSAWTGLFFDEVSKLWMVTCSTPIYIEDQFLGSVHHDVTVNELIERSLNDRLAGAINFIVHEDGRLIAHPHYFDEIKRKEGRYNIGSSNNETLSRQLTTITSVIREDVVSSEQNDSFLAIAKIMGPNWYIVTEFPKALVRASAWESAGVLLVAGLTSLILEVLILFFVMKKQVSEPLLELVNLTERVMHGDFHSTKLESREDELGQLANSFGDMVEVIRERDLQLERYTVDLELLVSERTMELDQQKALVANANKLSALGEMAAGIAHEINTPLATIKLLTSQVQHEMSSGIPDLDGLNDHLVNIDRTVDRLAKIVRGLKSFSRDGSEDPFEMTNLHQVIDDTISLCSERCRLHGIELRTHLTAAPLSVYCRSIQICQVLLNLINNAHDAVENLEEKWIEISTEEHDDCVELRVTDSGKGIPPEIAEKIFNPFFTTKGVGRGTGMGLSISHGIVKRHGGTLILDPFKATTCFLVRLPKPLTKAA